MNITAVTFSGPRAHLSMADLRRLVAGNPSIPDTAEVRVWTGGDDDGYRKVDTVQFRWGVPEC